MRTQSSENDPTRHVIAGWMAFAACFFSWSVVVSAQQTQKPPLHGRHWMAITGKPLAATAGAMTFQKGGNAVDAAAAMLAATCTMWDVLSWGGETQALIFDPRTNRVVGINALGVAPAGATADFFRQQGRRYPPEYGPLAAVTPGTPGGLMTMLAEFGTLSLAEVLEPAMAMADGYPMEAETANTIETHKARIKRWKYSRDVLLPHLGESREAPFPGEIFRQPDLATMLRKLVEAEQQALREGMDRRQAIYAAQDRFYRGDIAQEFVRAVQEEGGLITLDDLANWHVKLEEPVSVNFKGIQVHKLTHWTQGPVMLQALKILEDIDLQKMGYNSTQYIHTLYQVMNLVYADRDFYYGDPAFPPTEPIRGLLSKEYAHHRAREIDWNQNNPRVLPGDPYPFQGESNPHVELLATWPETAFHRDHDDSKVTPVPPQDERLDPPTGTEDERRTGAFFRGTTSIQAADSNGWVVSMTPSGGWIPAVIAGRTGVGLSQRMQSFVLDSAENPFNVLEPGKQPRVTLTPTLALKHGKPFLSFAVQGGDTQDQNLLQFFLNVVEFEMTVQQATEAANFGSFQMRSSFGRHETIPGRILLNRNTADNIRQDLQAMGYSIVLGDRTSGPINAIFFDQEHQTFWGGSSHHGEDYGIGW